MDYDDPERGTGLAARTREFVDEVVIPKERELLGDRAPTPEELAALREEAKERGIYAPQVDEEYGGLGLDLRSALPVFEAAGRSLLGPPALRVDAPDEGNIHTLEMVGTEDQKERWLPPLVEGEISSAFAMTEPPAGGGSDPKMLKTTAEKDGDEWVIDGHKWWATNGGSASVYLVMARTDMDEHPYSGTSIILVPRDADGLEVVRDIPHLGGGGMGLGHAELKLDGVRVPAENLIGAENAGFVIAQQRLGPARLTHCMRFAGLAERALDIAFAYASEREAFGDRLSDKQSLRFELARRHTDLHAARTMVRHAAREIAAGNEARIEVAASKYFTANVVQESVDTAVQVCGGAGISKDLPLADFYENVRQFRIFDGPDEVHLRSIAREFLQDPPTGELANLPRFGE
ncbi:acyl-CoA dehydrogenase [Halobacteriales archaeon QS_8_69_26]|nr:MAG: acyl-CoA dehydrogenase [Halobacteriales archaeon QS_8_69_26]